jgi:hypothetical protein
MASLVSIVDHPNQKQLLLGHAGKNHVDVGKPEAYRNWDRFFADRRQPGEKYGYTGLRAWLEHLVELEILSGFTLSTVGSLTANAAELLEGGAERASAYQQVGLIAFGSRVYAPTLAVTREQLVQREIAERLFERTCRNVNDIGPEYHAAWREHGASKCQKSPLRRYFLANCTDAVRQESRERAGISGTTSVTPLQALEIEAHVPVTDPE